MKKIGFLISVILISCQGQNPTDIEENKNHKNNTLVTNEFNIDTISAKKDKKEKLKVLVLPPYDKIANRGISPNVQKYLQNELKKSKKIDIIEFPYKQLMNVPYQNVFDKKYCQPVIETVACDIIVMCKLDFVKQTGYMPRDGWNLRIRIYNIQTDKQIDSELLVDSLSPPGIKKILLETQEIIIKEIESTVANTTYR